MKRPTKGQLRWRAFTFLVAIGILIKSVSEGVSWMIYVSVVLIMLNCFAATVDLLSYGFYMIDRKKVQTELNARIAAVLRAGSEPRD